MCSIRHYRNRVCERSVQISEITAQKAQALAAHGQITLSQKITDRTRRDLKKVFQKSKPESAFLEAQPRFGASFQLWKSRCLKRPTPRVKIVETSFPKHASRPTNREAPVGKFASTFFHFGGEPIERKDLSNGKTDRGTCKNCVLACDDRRAGARNRAYAKGGVLGEPGRLIKPLELKSRLVPGFEIKLRKTKLEGPRPSNTTPRFHASRRGALGFSFLENQQ